MCVVILKPININLVCTFDVNAFYKSYIFTYVLTPYNRFSTSFSKTLKEYFTHVYLNINYLLTVMVGEFLLQ